MRKLSQQYYFRIEHLRIKQLAFDITFTVLYKCSVEVRVTSSLILRTRVENQ